MRGAAILLFSSVAFFAANQLVNAEPPLSKIGAAKRSETAVKSLRKFLETSPEHRGALEQQDFATVALTKGDTEAARDALSRDRLERIRQERAAEMKSQVLTQAEHKMPFFLRRFGKKSVEGHSLYISLHGGGGTTPAANDRQWENQKRLYQLQEGLAKLRGDDPGGYEHFVKIHAGKGHWMDGEDALAIPWMANRTRNPTPDRIVWKQDNVTHSQFYWLGVDDENRKRGTEIVADVQAQTISVSASGVNRVIVYPDDRFLDLEKPIKIRVGEKSVFEGVVSRTIATLSKTLERRGDPFLSFPGSVAIAIP